MSKTEEHFKLGKALNRSVILILGGFNPSAPSMAKTPGLTARSTVPLEGYCDKQRCHRIKDLVKESILFAVNKVTFNKMTKK